MVNILAKLRLMARKYFFYNLLLTAYVFDLCSPEIVLQLTLFCALHLKLRRPVAFKIV